jgi:hypothetical protein
MRTLYQKSGAPSGPWGGRGFRGQGSGFSQNQAVRNADSARSAVYAALRERSDHHRARPSVNRHPRGFPRCGRRRAPRRTLRPAPGCMRAGRQVAPAPAGARAGAFEIGSRARRGGRRWTRVRAVPPQHSPRPDIGRDPHGLPHRAGDGGTHNTGLWLRLRRAGNPSFTGPAPPLRMLGSQSRRYISLFGRGPHGLRLRAE